MTPMAANFNLVPAALLELKDPYAVIKAQIPTALVLLAAQIAILAVAGSGEARAELARHMARVALGHVAREYPHKLDHVSRVTRCADPPCASPGILRQLRLALVRSRLVDAADAAAAVSGDAGGGRDRAARRRDLHRGQPRRRAGLSRPRAFRRFRAALRLGVAAHAPSRGKRATRPVGAIAWLPSPALSPRASPLPAILTYPIQHRHARQQRVRADARARLGRRVRPGAGERDPRQGDWRFAADRDCRAWEPGGDEFLSPALPGAVHEALPARGRVPALVRTLPPARRRPRARHAVRHPATVSDRSDGKIAHLDGLNLSRAWCWRSLAPTLPGAERANAEAVAEVHLAAALPHLATDYAGEHWLASFALLALLAGDR